MNIKTTVNQKFIKVVPDGRIDSVTSGELQKELDSITRKGNREILIDFSEVTYISSAGLRVFLKVHGSLKQAGGNLMLTALPAHVMDVFKMGGFLKFFNIIEESEIDDGNAEQISARIQEENINGTSYKIKSINETKGKLRTIGSSSKLAKSDYSDSDMQVISARSIDYGTGLAAIGQNFDECKPYFGESVVIKNSLFFYPAMNNPNVDFMLSLDPEMDFNYNFLHGFSFSGDFSGILAFEARESFIDLNTLVEDISSMLNIDAAGVVMILESKGIFGMHLKKSPVIDNKPENGEEIFSDRNFTEWMNFPVEPTDFNSVIVASGLIRAKDNGRKFDEFFTSSTNHHIHAALFEQDLLNPDIDNFDNELTRIITTLEAKKVQHLLGKSKFSNGLIAVVPLELD